MKKKGKVIIDCNNRITIPKYIRMDLGLVEGEELRAKQKGDFIILARLKPSYQTDNEVFLKSLKKSFGHNFTVKV